MSAWVEVPGVAARKHPVVAHLLNAQELGLWEAGTDSERRARQPMETQTNELLESPYRQAAASCDKLQQPSPLLITHCRIS